MKVKTQVKVWSGAAAILLALIAWTFAFPPRHPLALLHVTDAAGRPVQGATIRPDGMRTKEGPYASGHYGWPAAAKELEGLEVVTDERGEALIPYPKYVFEKIETGQISFSVSHPDFVPDRPFRVVTAAPPAGAPWSVWKQFLADRLKSRTLVARPAPIVLERGAIVQLAALPDEFSRQGESFAQASGTADGQEGMWSSPESGVLLSRRIAAGSTYVRLVQLATNGGAWFSDVASILTVSEQTNDLRLAMHPGLRVRGRLDAAVPRPIRNGRVIAHVWPPGIPPQNGPPEWHAWAPCNEHGHFELPLLPAGELEILALSEGFISTNGGPNNIGHPQKHALTNDLEVTIGMEPTAVLEVLVLDDLGNPLPNARISCWPNMQYGQWSAVILGSDCFQTSDFFHLDPGGRKKLWTRDADSYTGTSNGSGLAQVRNLPTREKQFSIQHPKFQLPARDDGGGGKHRVAPMRLTPGATNRITVRLEPADQSAISHY